MRALTRDQYRQLPVTYNGLVVESTTRCNAKCGMCYQSSGPKGSPQWGKSALSSDEIKKILRDSISIPTLSPRFHLSGGEAFLNLDQAISVIRYAKALGYLDITATTNAFWANSDLRARKVAELLRKAGLTSLEISWDHWHMPFIRPETVSRCLDACFAHGIDTNLRLLTSRKHTAHDALECLDENAVKKASRITSGPVFPTGRASSEVPKEEIFSKGEPDENCHTYLNLTINAVGGVSPCCAGLDQSDLFSFGNVRQDSIDRIANRMSRSPLLRRIVFGGAASLLPIFQTRGVKLESEQFTGVCHLCWAIFQNRSAVEAIKAHYDERNRLAILKATAVLTGAQVKAAS